MMATDWNEKTDFPCDDCDGEGSGEVDDFSHKSGHFTRTVKCDRCKGMGVLTMPLGEYWQAQFDRVDAENLRQSRELNAAHARIVEQQKVIQSLRSGGDGGAATPAVPAGAQDMIPDTDPTGGVGITLGV